MHICSLLKLGLQYHPLTLCWMFFRYNKKGLIYINIIYVIWYNINDNLGLPFESVFILIHFLHYNSVFLRAWFTSWRKKTTRKQVQYYKVHWIVYKISCLDVDAHVFFFFCLLNLYCSVWSLICLSGSPTTASWITIIKAVPPSKLHFNP